MKNHSYWRLPGGVIVDFQRHHTDGITARTFSFLGLPIGLCVTALSWTREAYYGVRAQRPPGAWKRTVTAVLHGTGRVMSSYCPDPPKIWGGLALALPRFNLVLGWQTHAWLQKADAHALQPCEACAAAGLRGIVRET
ncbi:hypothetical protein ACWD7T_34395 [Streptomyces sp. 900116325]